MDLPGVHTKFVERHRGTLGEWLELLLPPEAIQEGPRGVTAFNGRFGFRDKPERVRFRFLDRTCAIEPDRLGLDLTVGAEAFATLAPDVRRVFITENEINFLAFPPHPRSLVLFGAGYGWSALAGARWLERCELHYWGDIDTHGFAILDALRAQFPHARSLLMDLETFSAFRDLHTPEPEPVKRDLPRLAPAERALFDSLRSGQGRLEQERIPFSLLEAALRKLDP